ncbi:MAG: tRNA (guanine-N7)-methyltransferase [Planctomycetota bacterium]
MPRHAIRTPKKARDLGSVFLTPDALPCPMTSQSLFGNTLPLEIEIGSGKGLFLANRSREVAGHNFLGIEIITKYARHAAERIVKSGGDERGNVKMLAGKAEELFTAAEDDPKVPASSLEALHVYFPDPWWKKKHRKRRVITESSIVDYAKSIRPGGRFHFWTDVLDYFEDTIEMIAAVTPQLGIPIPEPLRESTHHLDYHTHFERRSRREGIPVYRVCYEKRGDAPSR